MASKTLNTRLIQKHDIEANWKKATNFTPMKGEVIIYDAGLVEEGKPEVVDYVRIKIGDGETNVNNLPFFGGQIDFKAPDEIPEGYIVPEGTIILIPNTVTVESVEEDGVTPVMRTQTFYSAKAGAGLPVEETTYIANLRAGDGWGSVVQVEATTEGDMNATGTKYINPIATGQRSAAFGKYTVASGNQAMALNYDTRAIGKKSLAVNSNTETNGAASLAAGHVTKANGDQSVAFGTYNEANGHNSIVGGSNSFANGNNSIAFGRQATSQNEYSVALGEVVTANGKGSIAIGTTSTTDTSSGVSLAMGSNAHAKGANSLAFGVGVNAIGARSAAIGMSNTANANYSMALGKNTTTNGAYSLTQGYKTTTNGAYQVALGYLNKPENDKVLMVGYGSETTDENGNPVENPKNVMSVDITGQINANSLKLNETKMAEEDLKETLALNDILTTNTEKKSLVTRSNSTATGDQSVSLGIATHTQGAQSFSVGYNNTSKDARSSTMGQGNTANSKYSFAGGLNTNTVGQASFAYGQNLKVNSNQSVAFGKFNEGEATSVFSVGYGTDDNTRKDVVKASRYGELTINPAPAFANGVEATLTLGETSLTESGLAALLAGAGGAGAAVVCNFVGWDGDETGETDTAVWNAAMQELEESGKKILILQGKSGYLNISNIALNDLIVVGYNSGFELSEIDFSYDIKFENCTVLGGFYFAEGGVEFSNSVVYDVNFEAGPAYGSNSTNGNVEMHNCKSINGLHITSNNKNMYLDNCEFEYIEIFSSTSSTNISILNSTISNIVFYNWNPNENITLNQLYLYNNNILYPFNADEITSTATFTINKLTAIDNIGGDAFQICKDKQFGGENAWGGACGYVKINDLTLAHNIDTNKVLYDVKPQSGSQEIIETYLYADKWLNNTYPFANFETTPDEYVSSKVDLEVSLEGMSCTPDQKKAYDKAEMVGTIDNNIRAFGEVPTIDIPILLKVVHK